MAVEDLLVKIDATTEQLRREMKRADQTVASTAGKIDKQLSNIDNRFDRLGKSAANFAKGSLLVAAALGIKRAASGAIDTMREMEVQMASLKTATGSVEAAGMAFEQLQEFAAETPYALEQSVSAFIKLQNLGLDPSIESLRSYGNTASAMGKSLDQMIEAVADAATFQFERLKEFGIRASQQGDQVTFTFRGVKTTVRKEASEIEKYLRNIGETDFAGAMAERAATLDGALSNLGDSFSNLVMRIGDSGVADALADVARKISEIVDVVGEGIIALGGFFELSTNATSIDKINARLAVMRDKLFEVNKQLELARKYPGRLDAGSYAGYAQQAAELEAEISYFENRRQRMMTVRREAAAEDRKQDGGGSVGSATSKKSDPIQQYIDKLREEADTLGFTEQELKRYELAKLGANESTIRLAESLQGEIDAFEAIKAEEEATAEIFKKSEEALAAYDDELKQFADSLTRSVNPAQDVADELFRIEEAFARGYISADTYAEAVFNAMERMEGKVEETADKTKSVAEELGMTFSSAFEDAIVNGEKLSDLLKSLEQDIIRIITRRLVTEPLANAVGGFLDGLSLPGFATGGSFEIGAGTSMATLPGGVDNRLIMFAGRDGERVTVEPNGGGAKDSVNVVMNISTPDANSFRASRGQIEHQVRMAIRRAARND